MVRTVKNHHHQEEEEDEEDFISRTTDASSQKGFLFRKNIRILYT